MNVPCYNGHINTRYVVFMLHSVSIWRKVGGDNLTCFVIPVQFE